MNLIGQGSDTPLVSNSFTVRPGSADGLAGQTALMRPQNGLLSYQATDGFTSRGWAGSSRNAPGTFPSFPGSSSTGAQGGFLGLINNLINQLGALINQYAGETNAEGPGTQTVGDGTFASTGDPHLSETANVLDGSGKSSPVNRHFDSMTGHDNLLSSQDFDGGYRLSTAVTAPSDKGVTMNESATVHANSNLDTITMRNDGTFSITSSGNSVSMNPGQSVTLEGGEQVTRNTDGSLTVVAQNAYGGSISTTMAAKGGGVDVTAAVHNATVGGDIAGNSETPAPLRRILDSGARPLPTGPNAFA